MTWLRSPARRIVAGRDAGLRFAVRTPDGQPVHLEPYMGMTGHAIVCRDDGQVFVHLHPQGTISMAAQQLLADRAQHPRPAAPLTAARFLSRASRQSETAKHLDLPLYRTAADSAMNAMPGMDMPSPTIGQGDISFPYEFPEPGRYRLWIQVKSAGQILTGVFDIDVAKAN